MVPSLRAGDSLTPQLTEYPLPKHEKQPGWIEFHHDIVNPFLDSLHWWDGFVRDTTLWSCQPTKSSKKMPSKKHDMSRQEPPKAAGESETEREITYQLRNLERENDREVGLMQVVYDDSALFTFAENNVASGAYLRQSDSIWVLQVDDLKLPGDSLGYSIKGRGSSVIVNGHDLNREHGYTESFNYHYLNGKPFHFFRKNQQYGFRFEGIEHDLSFDEIIHNRCCEPGIANPMFGADRFYFFGRRGETWVLVTGRVKSN